MGAFDYFLEVPRNDKATREVNGSKILFVEGLDECLLLDRMLGQLHADKESVQIIQYGGKNKFELNLKLMLRDRRFVAESVSRLAVFQDADESFDKTLDRISKIMQDCGLPNVPLGSFTHTTLTPWLEYGAFIFPDNSDAGNLESLLIKAPTDSGKRDAAQAFVRSHANERDSEDPKRIAQSYLAVQQTLCRGAGQGGRDGFFDLQAAVLADLWDYLRRCIA